MKKRYIVWLTLLGLLLLCAVFAKPVIWRVALWRSTQQHPGELAKAVAFFRDVLENDAPTKEWLDRADLEDNKVTDFYTLKILFIECGTSLPDLEKGQVLMVSKTDEITRYSFFNRSACSQISLTLTNHQSGQWTLRYFFPDGNCLFEPDYNDDGIVDKRDVDLARDLKQHGT